LTASLEEDWIGSHGSWAPEKRVSPQVVQFRLAAPVNMETCSYSPFFRSACKQPTRSWRPSTQSSCGNSTSWREIQPTSLRTRGSSTNWQHTGAPWRRTRPKFVRSAPGCTNNERWTTRRTTLLELTPHRRLTHARGLNSETLPRKARGAETGASRISRWSYFVTRSQTNSVSTTGLLSSASSTRKVNWFGPWNENHRRVARPTALGFWLMS